jgi:hypothetical protein
MWMFFLTFYEKYPHLHRWLATASFFIPSVFFWGSGLLKDTITLGFLGIATFEIHKVFIEKRRSFTNVLLLLVSLYGIYAIKVYILLIFLPAVILWTFLANLQSIRSIVLKVMLFPFVISIAIALAYFAMLKSTEGDKKYDLDNIARTAQITAYDIRYYTGRNAGSGYSIGELDGTLGSMIRLALRQLTLLVQAIFVGSKQSIMLFRPWKALFYWSYRFI